MRLRAMAAIVWLGAAAFATAADRVASLLDPVTSLDQNAPGRMNDANVTS